MKNKVCIVTGATSGIGFETALALANEGAEVVILGRNAEKGQRVQRVIAEDAENEQVHFIQTELSRMNSVREAAREIRERWERVDVLINNAGTWVSKHTLTEDQIETQLAVHHVAPFLLTHLLLPAMLPTEDARIINVNSDSHFKARLDLNDLHLYKNYNGLRAYARTKLANVMFTYELDRRLRALGLDHVSVNAVQPGLVKTDIGLKETISLHGLAWKIRRMGGVSPQQGAATSIFLATSSRVKGESGKYWDKRQPKPSSKRSYNEAEAQRLWELTEQMCNIESFFPETVNRNQ